MSIKIVSFLDPSGLIMNMRKSFTEDNLPLYLSFYRALDMESIIEPIGESIMKVNAETQSYRFSGSVHKFSDPLSDIESEVDKIGIKTRELEMRLKSANLGY